ncbi:MFS transporter [Aldersonia sp. NBC_00410]|uniref:MFS transporter n=1 Tax=Aldersonia sp. NBC_00410 TaxID=2975954 RepID=UPI00224F75FF|nr:MFS transporter [Aldersonia sp. NBC_00410]MCX5043829.1 MFS transporter [Aldersonia sp. NBC_00410]
MDRATNSPASPNVAAVEETGFGTAIVPIIVLCFGGMMAALSQTLVIPIQPELPHLLNTSVGNASWVVTATLLGAAVAMPVSGRLGDMYGKQRVLAVSAALLVVGSLICAVSSILPIVIAGRVVQGFAMGFIPVGISLIREITPPRLTSTAIAAMSATLGVGGAIGLPLSAWIAQNFNWHGLFWFAAGAGLVVMIAVLTLLPHVHDENGGRLDLGGVIGLAIGLVSALVAITKGNAWGWSDGKTLGLLIGGIVVLLLWGWYELRVTDPLVDLRTTARPAVLLTNLAGLTVGFGMMAQALIIPQLLEMPAATGYGLGQSLLAAGLWMAPGGLMMLVFAPVSSRLINGIGAKYTLMIGATVLGTGYLAATLLMHAPWQLALASLISSAGVGIGYAAMPTLIMSSVPMNEAGAAVGLNSLMRSVGTTTASAVMAALLTRSTIPFGSAVVPTESAFRLCFVVGAVAAFATVAIVLFIPVVKAKAQAGQESGEYSVERDHANATA